MLFRIKKKTVLNSSIKNLCYKKIFLGCCVDLRKSNQKKTFKGLYVALICFDIHSPSFLLYNFYIHFSTLKKIEQKCMTFDYEFGYYFPLFSSLLKIKGRRKGE